MRALDSLSPHLDPIAMAHIKNNTIARNLQMKNYIMNHLKPVSGSSSLSSQ